MDFMLLNTFAKKDPVIVIIVLFVLYSRVNLEVLLTPTNSVRW